jgi:chemotaxis protein histidine kinase CheA
MTRARVARTNAVLPAQRQNVTAVHVDEMIGNQEVVMKNIGPPYARARIARDGARTGEIV